MQAKQLLTDIYTSSEITNCISKLRPVHLQQDILQHTFLELFEKDGRFIVDLHERGKLKAYIVKVLYNTSVYTHNKFSKENGREIPCDTSCYEFIKHIKDDNEFEETKDKEATLQCAFSKMHWYKVEVLRLYSTLGT